jgi:D-beta-D-heptose 7-phosphate kinase/D-beta-D-heptose 1-phosphate adenosyltransferase
MTLHIPDFSKTRVLVVGDLMLDRYWHGGTSRISPEAPVPVVHVNQSEDRPGGAGNVALNIAALGAKVTVVGPTGDDEAANTLEACLNAAKVDCKFTRFADSPTVTKLRVLSRHQQLIRLDFEEGFDSADFSQMLEEFKQQLPEADAVVLSDYGKGALRNSIELIELARKAGKPVLVDPKGNDFSLYQGATLITPNLNEFEDVVGSCSDESELVSRGDGLIKANKLDALLVTRGEHGMTLLRSGEKELHLPTQAREVFDVTGAGDTVISVLAATLGANGSLPDAMALANLAAGVVVGKLGTATVSLPELRRAVQEHQNNGSGVVSEEQLVLMVEDARAHDESIVMTNGCFDILHAGHVAYLERAKQLGDRLIIAVNDDGSVRQLKGEGRPVNTLARRMAVLAALGSVDWVVPFSEETPERLMCRILPDLLVKGGDYRPEDIAGYQCVKDNGGDIKVLGFEDGCSTSDIIDVIRKSD